MNQPKKKSGRRMAEERVAFMQNVFGTMSIYFSRNKTADRDNTPNVTILYGSNNPKYPYSHVLSTMTTPELHLYSELINLAIEMARPVVAERDRIAAEANEEGDDSYSRIYRQKPQLIVRPPSEDESQHPIWNQLIARLFDSPHCIKNATAFRERRANMNFWTDEDASDAI